MTPAPPTPPPASKAAERLDVRGVRSNLGRRSVRSGAVRFAEQASVLVLSVASAAALARLLRPEDFGLMAMVSVPMALIMNLKHFGLPMALVHRDDVRPEAADALFWLTAGLSAGACALMAASGPLLALFFGEPTLIALTAATAAALLVLALGASHEALLMRQMRFATLSVISVGATFGGMAVGIAAAWADLGTWALVLQVAATNAFHTVLWWGAARWWPAFRLRAWRRSGLRALLGYGFPYAGFSAVEHVGRNADRVVIGYAAGPAVLGLYDNAYRWSLFPLQQVFKPLLGVAVSGLSRVRHQPAVFRQYVRRSVLPVLAVALPALAFVVAAADPVVRVLLGLQWLDAIPLLRWLAAAAYVRCFSMIARWLFLAEGRTRKQFRWGLVSAPVMITAVVVGVQWGVYGVAVAFFVASVALAVPEWAVALWGSRVRARDLAAAAWRPVTASVGAAVAVWVAPFLPTGAVLAVLASAGLFGAVYAALWLALPGGPGATREVLALLRSVLPSSARR